MRPPGPGSEPPTPGIRRWLPRGIAPLGYRDFALYWIGQTTSGTGRGIELTGTVWLAYELSRSPVELGLIGLARAVPSVVLAPVAGVIADRVEPARLLMATQIAGLIASLWLGLLILTGSVEMWHIYVQVAVQGFTQAFDTAARQALFPRLVPRRFISEAVTLNSTAGRVSGLVGPAIGGLAIATLGSAWPFLINAATFPVLVVALLLLRHLDPAPPLAPSSFVADMRDGLTYILRAPILRGLLQLDVVFALFQLNPVMITILALEVIRVGPEGLGGLLSARALGAMAGVAVLLTLGHPERQGRFAVVCTIVYAACLVPLALTTSFALSFVLIALTGMLDSLVSVTRHSVMQLAAPPEMRGRVMSNMAIVTRLGQLGQTQSGVVVAAVGPLAAVLVSAVAIALSAGLTGYGNRLLWDSSRSDLTE